MRDCDFLGLGRNEDCERRRSVAPVEGRKGKELSLARWRKTLKGLLIPWAESFSRSVDGVKDSILLNDHNRAKQSKIDDPVHRFCWIGAKFRRRSIAW